ncbi:hypothetical protein PMAYCL1PPCAC_33432, partial [Pristionchus mayeri]
RMSDSSGPPATPALNQESNRPGVQWYDSPLSFHRRVKSDIPKNSSEMEEDPFFGKKMESEESSNSCDGFNARLPFSSRKFRRRLRPSTVSEIWNGREREGKIDGEEMLEQMDDEASSPASSVSFQANRGDVIELGRRSIQLLQSRCTVIADTEDCDITTPKRKRRMGEEEKEDNEEEDENRGNMSGVTLLTPSLSRGSDSKRGCALGAANGIGAPLSSVSSSSVSIDSSILTPRRVSGGRTYKRDELVDTPESSLKGEKKEDKKAIRRAKYGHYPDFDSDDSFYDSE